MRTNPASTLGGNAIFEFESGKLGNRIPDATRPKGFRLVGDADFESCAAVAGAITPVPRGVGPMTITMLLWNTLESAAR